MLKRFWSFTSRILKADVGAAIKPVLWFDVSRVLLFDVNRILRWDVGRALQRPIPPVVLKAFAGYVIAGVFIAIISPALRDVGWRLPQWAALLILMATVGAFIATDLRRSASIPRP